MPVQFPANTRAVDNNRCMSPTGCLSQLPTSTPVTGCAPSSTRGSSIMGTTTTMAIIATSSPAAILFHASSSTTTSPSLLPPIAASVWSASHPPRAPRLSRRDARPATAATSSTLAVTSALRPLGPSAAALGSYSAAAGPSRGLPRRSHDEADRRQAYSRGSMTLVAAAGGAGATSEDLDLEGQQIAEDYYSILGLTSDATPEEVKAAYYACMKACHPDLSGNHPDSVAFCSFVNEIYEVLSDPEMRAVYDEIKGYSVSATNPFQDTRYERDQVFVDEFTCIGCKNCSNTAEATFEMEELYGRARVFNQKGDSVDRVQEAIDTCPVQCIHWVTAPQLALLEDEMRRMERVSVCLMMANQGSKGNSDVFGQASWRWEKRRRQAEARARLRAMREKRKAESAAAGKGWGDAFWAAARSATGDAGTEDGASGSPLSKDKAEKAAAAARRWREYSRKGVDRRRGLMLPSQAGMPDDAAFAQMESCKLDPNDISSDEEDSRNGSNSSCSSTSAASAVAAAGLGLKPMGAEKDALAR